MSRYKFEHLFSCHLPLLTTSGSKVMILNTNIYINARGAFAEIRRIPAVPSQPDPFKDGVGKRNRTVGSSPPIS